MSDDTEDLVLAILKDIQARMGRMEERMTNLELRMTVQEQLGDAGRLASRQP